MFAHDDGCERVLARIETDDGEHPIANKPCDIHEKLISAQLRRFAQSREVAFRVHVVQDHIDLVLSGP